MVSGSGVLDVSGMKVTRRAASRAITPNTTRGTWAPYILSSTINGAICDYFAINVYLFGIFFADHGADPGPERAGSEARCPDHGGEHLGGEDVAHGQGVDGGDPACGQRDRDRGMLIFHTEQIEDENGPLVREVVQRDKVGETETGASDAINLALEERFILNISYILPVEQNQSYSSSSFE